ncbi:hypothetical protein KKE06_03260 [Candidatus Micrarchaeota archaeon]|nr:hypothetical protein [Candidatus Micrarchaeota archaeon]
MATKKARTSFPQGPRRVRIVGPLTLKKLKDARRQIVRKLVRKKSVPWTEGLANWKKRVLAGKPKRIRIPPKGTSIIGIQRWKEEQPFHEVYRTCQSIVLSERLTKQERQKVQAFNLILDRVLAHWWKHTRKVPKLIGQAVDLDIIGRQKWAVDWQNQIMDQIGPVYNIMIKLQEQEYGTGPPPRRPA